MAQRSHESPMDFEWANNTGPINSQSPFITAQRQLQEKGTKRPFSIFGSPNKPSTPGLRDPASAPSQSFLFSSDALPQTNSPSNPFPPTPSWFNNPKFTTPRKPVSDVVSSTDNTPISPDKGEEADSDATPDIMSLRSRAGNLFRTFTGQKEGLAPPKKEAEAAKAAAVASPGRGEVPRGYSTKGQKRVEKRRNKMVMTRKRGVTMENEDSEMESDARGKLINRPGGKKRDAAPNADHGQTDTQAAGRSGKLERVFSFLETHPSLPHILSFYAQLLLNFFLVFSFMYIIYSFWATIRDDVDSRVEQASAEILADMAVCAQHYRDNRCERETRLPALEAACDGWERCMQRDAKRVGRARVSAHTFAQIFNSFIEPISYKAMIFTVVVVFGSIVASNFAFGFFRNKAGSHFHASPPYSYPPPPPTPQRYPSGGFHGGMLEHNDAGGYWTPHGNRQMGLEPAPSGPYGGGEGKGSPVKSLMYH